MLLAARPAPSQGLQLALSVGSSTITAPNPARATLRFHNSGRQTLWLYRPVGDISQISQGNPLEMEASEPGPNQTSGGPVLAIHLIPANPQGAGDAAAAAHGKVILTPGFPHPKLVALPPGGNFEETVSLQLEPVRTKDGNHPAWGRYKLSVTYSAHYSNQDDLARNLNFNLWHDSLRSNPVTVNLRPPTAQGSIEGVVLDSYQRPFAGILATLSNDEDQPLEQLYTDGQGRFAFVHLAPGRYWITARQLGSAEDTTIYRHVDLGAASPQAIPSLMMIPRDHNKPEQLLHKPVIFRVTDDAGHPLPEVKLKIVWSAGTVMQDFKTVTNQQGYAVVELLPGQNFVTLRQHGCRSEDRRADVAPGGGVDAFAFNYNCSRK